MVPRTPGIPEPLYVPLRATLIKCAEFGNPDVLVAVFGHDKLEPFQEDLPLANAVGARVDMTIEYLRSKYLLGIEDTSENALSIFLRILAERRSEKNAQRKQLETLAQQWEWFCQRPYSRQEMSLAEANPQMAQMLYMADAQKMLASARAVANVSVRRFRNGVESGSATGTGWLVTPTLALTCWHVIEALDPSYEDTIQPDDLQAQVLNANLTFDYMAAGEGLQYGIAQLEYPTLASHPLDYALLRLRDRGDAPLQDRGYLRLDVEAPLTAQTSLYIIQHPLGQPQQGAGDTYVQLSPTPQRVLYRTPTQPGTSGAPVFNRVNWRVVALHNGENQDACLREGTLLKAILTELQQNRSDLYSEIMRSQKE